MRLKGREFALRSATAATLYSLVRGFNAQVIEQSEIGRGKDLNQRLVSYTLNKRTLGLTYLGRSER